MHYFRHKMSLHQQHEPVLVRSQRCEYDHLKTHWEPKIIDHNIAVVLRQLFYSKTSFIVLSPGHTGSVFCFISMDVQDVRTQRNVNGQQAWWGF